MKRTIYGSGLMLLMAGAAIAQSAGTAGLDRIDQEQMMRKFQGALADRPIRIALDQDLKSGKPGRWWSNPYTAQRLNLTSDQLKKMDDIFQQYRIQLIDLKAGLEKAEAMLEPMVSADQPDDAKVMAQIDRVAQSRADLEKTNSRMLWSIRRVLTPDQWKDLNGAGSKPGPMKVLKP